MTRTTRKTVSFAVCVAILLVAVSALAWATSGFKNWNAESWFDYWGNGVPAVTAPEAPEQQPEASGMTMQSAKASSSDLPGIFTDSDDGVATVTVPTVPAPELIRAKRAFLFHVPGDEATVAANYKDWKLHIELYYDGFGHFLQPEYRTQPLSKADGARMSGYLEVPFSVLYQYAQQAMNNATTITVQPNEMFISYKAYAIHPNGFHSDEISGEFFVPLLGIVNTDYAYSYSDGVLTVPMYCDTSAVPANPGKGQLSYYGYEIRVYPSEIKYSLTTPEYTNLIGLPSDVADGCNIEYDGNQPIVRKAGNAIAFDISNMSAGYTVDLTKLSFAGETHELCSIVLVPFAYIMDGANTAHKAYVVLDDIDIFYFGIGKLPTPQNIRLDGTDIKWDIVSGANGYAVFMDDDTDNYVTVDTNSFSAVDLSGGEHTVRIRALGNVGKTLASKENATMRLTAYNASNNITQIIALNFVIDGDTLTKLVPQGKAIKDYLYDVVIDDREFGGWFYDSGYTTPVSETDILEKDTTIYARLSDRLVTERPMTWWEKNMWYILIPCGIIAGVLIITVIVAIVQSKRKH